MQPWIASRGGPLLCAAGDAARSWRGARASSIGRRETDYERACAVPGYVGVLAAGASEGLVLGDEPSQSTFLTIDGQWSIARWIACASPDDARRVLAGVPGTLPELEPARVVRFDGDSLHLFDSALPLEDAGAPLVASIQPGRYSVSTQRLAEPDRFEFLIHRLRRID